jgi:AIR synthase-related protein
MTLDALAATLRAGRGLAHKRDIGDVANAMARLAGGDREQAVLVGDDCAAIPDRDGFLLFAIEGFLNEFVEQDPWFAGYCSVMVNASDVYAMGGRPLAVIDALWSNGFATAEPILAGLTAASKTYNIPIVGGHTNNRNTQSQLSAAILGRAKYLLSSFHAEPDEVLVAAIDLRGRYREPNAYWDASTASPPDRLRNDLELLPTIAEAGLCASAKDISMGGIIGTLLMLLESSGIGAELDIDAIPRPKDADLPRWLQSFPSYGFVLSVKEKHLASVLKLFCDRDIAASAIGRTNRSHILRLSQGNHKTDFWNLDETPLIGFTKRPPREALP